MWIAVFPNTSGALDYAEISWGFDGRVVPDQFNLLTVVVRNLDKKPFDGVVTLERTQGIGKIGGTEVKECYLEPGNSRILQFYPRVTGLSQWQLRDGVGHAEIDPPTEGLPAIVRLVDSEDPLRLSKALKAFPHQYFPTSICGTTGLFAAVTDYSPAFAPAQKVAFVEWLLAGGRLHVFLSPDDQFPDFDDPRLEMTGPQLAVGKSFKQKIGNGTVTWHRRTIANLTTAEASAVEPTRLPLDERNYYGSIDTTIFHDLQDLTRLDIAWPVVYLSAITYIILLGPGHYLWMRRRPRDYRMVLVVLGATIALFAALFAYIGRRGYGEKTQASTVSLARHIDGTRYDVTSWGNVFVTKGDDYKLLHSSIHNFYSTGETYESVGATFTNGRDGRMETEIPVFSSRTFVHSGVLDGMPRPELLSDTGVGLSRSIEWRTIPGIAIANAWVRFRNSVYEADSIFAEGKIKLTNARLYHPVESDYSSYPVPDRTEDAEQLLGSGRHLFHRMLAMMEYEKPKWVPFLGDDAIELYLLTSMPESFRLTGDQISTQQGVTLFRFTYPAQNQP
ncbi:MAG: hypothetical protein KDN22_03700 [Verrucomicrobiae bacterium]|nr:hypothetical protein [Verrucomicrobiae bacterium]